MNAAVRSILAVAIAMVAPGLATADTGTNPARELAGLWEAKRVFGPDIHGTLLIEQVAGGWRAEIAGRSAPVHVKGDAVAFELPEGHGTFKGKFAEKRSEIVGHWIQPPRGENGTSYASPVTLANCGQERWRGVVTPLDDATTLYLMVRANADGSVGVFLRNPERNFGRFLDGARIEQDGDAVRIVAPGTGAEKRRVMAEGSKRDDALSLYVSPDGATFDFHRVKESGASDFYPRGRPNAAYSYAPPSNGDDGWPTATLADVGISRDGIEKFVRMLIDTPIDSVHSQEVHGFLLARHGKLVLEEYFHGEHREKPHDTRSASKSLTATMTGAAIRAGLPIDVSTSVYRVMNGGQFPSGLDERKQALTVEHLLTMSSGLDCDDKSDSSVGNENTMQEQRDQPDWYRYTLDLRMVRNPGEKSVYGSANANLLGGVLARSTGRLLPELFHELIAQPLGINRYYMNLTPTGDAYMGGGMRLLPRDFMKLGQVMLNGGTWNGHRILTPEWCRTAVAPRCELAGIHYGYLWWVIDYPYKDRTVRAFFAGGNGGQVVIGIPELDLVVAFYGGNYGDRATYVPQREYAPKYILPAVDRGG
jgi:CubicO group peptidase (beta-lactamase class C family)